MTATRIAPLEDGHLTYVDIAALLEHLGTGPVVLVGLSMGAGTAVDVAVEHPERVRALVVSGTGVPDWRPMDRAVSP